MKALLLKDWYMMKAYCKSYLLVAVVFMAVSFFSNGDLFFTFYPCLLCGMIPVSLLGYDEQSRWMQYSATMPYTKAQLVSAKYLVGLLAQGAMLLVTGTVQAIKMAADGSFVLGEFAVFMLLLMSMAAFTSSIATPFMFKLGVEKGRMAYYIMIGVASASGVMAKSILRGQTSDEVQLDGVLIAVAVIGIGVYLLSWYLSVVFFKEREL